jgi:hypothetical protein
MGVVLGLVWELRQGSGIESPWFRIRYDPRQTRFVLAKYGALAFDQQGLRRSIGSG